MADWIKWKPGKFLNGVIGLNIIEIGVYAIVLNMIYEHDGAVAYDVAGIAKRSGVRRAMDAAKALTSLLAKEKLFLIDGKLSNARAEKTLAELSGSRREDDGKKREGDGKKREGDTFKSGIPNKIKETLARAPASDKNKNKNKNKIRVEPKGSLSVLGKPTRKISYPQDFEEFWKAYPVDPLMSKKEAGAEWTRLSAEDRTAALKAVPAFRRHCAADATYRPLHAVRFLSQRRFEGFANGAVMASPNQTTQPTLEQLEEKWGVKLASPPQTTRN